MYYAKINGKVMPTPFLTHYEAFQEVERLQKVTTVWHYDIVTDDEIKRDTVIKKQKDALTELSFTKVLLIIIAILLMALLQK